MTPQQVGKRLASKLNKLNRNSIIAGANQADPPFIKPKSRNDILREAIAPTYQPGAIALAAVNPSRTIDELLAEWRATYPFWFYANDQSQKQI